MPSSILLATILLLQIYEGRRVHVLPFWAHTVVLCLAITLGVLTPMLNVSGLRTSKAIGLAMVFVTVGLLSLRVGYTGRSERTRLVGILVFVLLLGAVFLQLHATATVALHGLDVSAFVEPFTLNVGSPGLSDNVRVFATYYVARGGILATVGWAAILVTAVNALSVVQAKEEHQISPSVSLIHAIATHLQIVGCLLLIAGGMLAPPEIRNLHAAFRHHRFIQEQQGLNCLVAKEYARLTESWELRDEVDAIIRLKQAKSD